MKLTAKLAYSQLTVNKKRTAWTLLGIVLSAAMLNAAFGFLSSYYVLLTKDAGVDFTDKNAYILTVAGAGAVIGFIIAAVSVNVVSNAFRVSAGERTAQFGILKSAGATKRQIARTVMSEGIILSAIGIPAGLALGLGMAFIAVNAADHLLSAWNKIDNIGTEFTFEFVVAWQAIAASAVLSFVTVLLSAWLPAGRAAKIPAVEAIRGTGELRLNVRHFRSNRLAGKLFGFEGTLALKSLKRSRRSFRAAMVSLTVSVILFITAGGIGAQADNLTGLFFPKINSSVAAQAMSHFEILLSDESEEADFIYTPIGSETVNEITAKLRGFPDTSLIGAGGFYHDSTAVLPENMITPEMSEIIGSRRSDGSYKVFVWLLAADPETYAGLCGQAGVPTGSNILVNYYRHIADNGRISAFPPYRFDNQTIRVESAGIPAGELTLHGELREVPEELLYGSAGVNGELVVIVPKLDALYFNWFADPADKDGFIEHANAVLNKSIPKDDDIEMLIQVTDVSAANDAVLGIIRMVMMLIYGFVGMLTLISLTNVISTISANVRSRSREFAVLLSVGMTYGGLNRMLNLESALCSVKSLIVGLPLGCAASYLIYRFMMVSMGFDYRFPWLAVMCCVLGVFAITWVTMRYSIIQIRSGSIVEKIRKEAV
jgi:putative ABC transport system permease protein